MFSIKKFSFKALIFLIITVSIYGKSNTPLEISNFTKLTSHKEMMSYLEDLVDGNSLVEMKIIGKSVNRLEIPALFFTKESKFGIKRDAKPIVLISAQQHGNEPAGKEALLIVANKLLNEEKSLLVNLDIILVPQVNPDGAEAGVRRNANKMDLNRNHVILSEPESQAIHKLFLDWMPEVTLDIHETDVLKKDWIANGIIKDAEEMFGAVSNLNIPKDIIDYSRNTFLPSVGKKINTDGFRYSEYIVGSPFNGKIVRHSTTNVNDGRQSMGIYNTMSFVVECIRFGDLITKIERRVSGHVSAVNSFLKTIDENHKYILSLINNERSKLLEEKSGKRIAIQMDYYKDSKNKYLNFPIFNLKTWHHEITKLDNYYPLVKIKKTVTKPFAYIFSANEKKLIKLLGKHQIEVERLKNDSEIDVKKYYILHVTPSREEGKKSEAIDLQTTYEKMKFKSGDFIVYLNQKSSNLIPLLLEPESSYGFLSDRSGRKYRLKEYLKEGYFYPIFRIESPTNINSQKN